MHTLKIQGFEFIQHGDKLYTTLMPVDDLLKLHKIDKLTETNTDGYQRNVSESRIKNAAKYIMSPEGLFPQSILVNLRTPKKIAFNGTKIKEGLKIGTITFRGNLWLIDGQHRLLAIEKAIEERPILKAMVLPLTILNMPREREQRLFFVINDKQKGVKTDLVQNLISRAMEKSPEQAKRMFDLEGRRAYVGIAIPVLQILAKKRNSPWKDRIRFANATKKSKFQATQAMVAEAIAKIIQGRISFDDEDYDKSLASLLIDYWNAIGEIYPDAFKNPENYTIHRTSGIHSFSRIFNEIEDICKTKYGECTRSQMKKILLKVKANLDKFDSGNSGIDFWDKKEGNDLAKSSSMKSVGALVEIMRKGLSD